MPLPEQRRQQLDGIVSQMAANGETDDAIRAVVADFKSKYASADTTAAPSGPEGSAPARFASGVMKNANPVAMVAGAVNAVAHPIDTGAAIAGQMGDQWEKADQRFRAAKDEHGTMRLADAMEGAERTMAGSVPVFGPAAAAAGERIASGDVAGGFGEGVGLIGSVFAPRAVPPLARGTSAAVRGGVSAAGKLPAPVLAVAGHLMGVPGVSMAAKVAKAVWLIRKLGEEGAIRAAQAEARGAVAAPEAAAPPTMAPAPAEAPPAPVEPPPAPMAAEPAPPRPAPAPAAEAPRYQHVPPRDLDPRIVEAMAQGAPHSFIGDMMRAIEAGKEPPRWSRGAPSEPPPAAPAKAAPVQWGVTNADGSVTRVNSRAAAEGLQRFRAAKGLPTGDVVDVSSPAKPAAAKAAPLEANDVAAKVQSLRAKGLSRPQIANALRDTHGIKGAAARKVVDLVLDGVQEDARPVAVGE